MHSRENMEMSFDKTVECAVKVSAILKGFTNVIVVKL